MDRKVGNAFSLAVDGTTPHQGIETDEGDALAAAISGSVDGTTPHQGIETALS